MGAAAPALTAVTPAQAPSPLRGKAPERQRPRNVLLLMADQHKPGALGAAGDRVARTPQLDSLASTGVLFDHAYCSDPVCIPSRASMLTGRSVHKLKPYATWPFAIKTLAHYFGNAGYMTGLIGKMHFMDAQTHGFDYNLQFNDWYQYLGPKTRLYVEETFYPDSGEGLPQIVDLWHESGDPWTGSINRDGREGLALPGRISALPEKDHFESFVARESIRFLERFGRKQPFVLISSFLKPHAPFMPAERFGAMFHAQDMKLPETWGKVDLAAVPKFVRESIHYHWVTPELHDPEQAKLRIAMYYACLAQTDDNVGKILQALKDLGLERDTIVLYTADHGEMLGEHGLWQKFVFYDSSVGVPLIFRVPGVTPENVHCNTPVSHIQILPTLADLCGVPVPSDLDGSSLGPSLRNPHQLLDTTVYAEHALETKAAGCMIRHGNFKYSYYSHDMPELYDLAADPAEMKNLALLPEYRSKADEMKRELFAWHVPEETPVG